MARLDLPQRLPGKQLNPTVQTVAELHYGALVAGWGGPRRARLEGAIQATTVVPVTDTLVRTVARARFECRGIGHPLAGPSHHADPWIAATAIHIEAQLVTEDGMFRDVPGLRIA